MGDLHTFERAGMADVNATETLIAEIHQLLNRGEQTRATALIAQLRTVGPHDDLADLFAIIGQFLETRDSAWAEQAFQTILARQPAADVQRRALTALGRICYEQGRWQEAIERFQASLSFVGDHPVEKARLLQNIAIMYRRGFDQAVMGADALAQARSYATQALALIEPIENPTATVLELQGYAWNTLGTIHLNEGEFAQALPCYERKLAICQRMDDRQGVAEATKNIGEILHRQSEWGRALSHYHQALHYFQEQKNLAEILDTYADIAELHREQGDATRTLAAYENALVTCDQLRAAITSLEARTTFFATVAEIFANTILYCVDQQWDELAFNYAERARGRAFLDLLTNSQETTHDSSGVPLSEAMPAKNKAGQFAAIPTTLPELQAILPADTLFLTYFTTGLYDSLAARVSRRSSLIRHRFPREATLLFAITRSDCQLFDLGFSPNLLLPSDLDQIALRNIEQEADRTFLSTKLLAPVMPLIAQSRQVIVAPHGPTHYVPFHALTGPDGFTFQHESAPTLTYMPSASVLRQTYHKSMSIVDSSNGQRCLAVGYDQRQANPSTNNRSGALFFAESEAEAIAGQFAGKALTGPNSKKALLIRQAPEYHYLHFACHGLFATDAPMSSWLQIGPDERLTAQEVLDLFTLKARLVTLSACESGAGQVRRGDELMGFVRAFMVAGTTALLLTLWPVDDLATRIFMEVFYQQLQQSAPLATALKVAQQFLCQQTRAEVQELAQSYVGAEPVDWHAPQFQHVWSGDKDEYLYAAPRYWAAFILVGGIADHSSSAS